MKQRPARWAMAALGLVLMSGCAGSGPGLGVAATVGGSPISVDKVERFASAQCSARAASGEPGATIPRSQVNNGTLGFLIEAELTRQYAEELSLTPRTDIVRLLSQDAEERLDQLPADERDAYRDGIRLEKESLDLLAQIGEQETGQEFSVENFQNLALAGFSQRSEWQDSVDIETAQRYGPDEEGWPGMGDASVSVPSGEFAKQATAKEPSPEWAAALPPGQRCG